MPGAATHAVALTGIAAVDGLMQGSAWSFGSGPRLLTYSLNDQWLEAGAANDLPVANGTWTPALSAALARAFATWSNVADISFLQVAGSTSAARSSADIATTAMGNALHAAGVLGLSIFPDPAFTDAYLSIHNASRTDYPNAEGDVVFGDADAAFTHLGNGGRGFAVMVHELGHALGLKHPGDDGGNGRPTFNDLGMDNLASSNQTIMVGTLGANSGQDNYAATPMPLDILAIQQLYGANTSSHIGDDVYTVALNGFKQTVWDAGGTDTLDASQLVAGVSLDLRGGSVMLLPQSTVWAIAYGVSVENLKSGAGADTLQGNYADNLIDGGGGVDTMRGGAGDDIYIVSDSADLVVELPGEGHDTVRSAASFVLPDEVENLELTVRGFNPSTGIGNSAANAIAGNLYGNLLSGLAGDDTLNGGAGDDRLVGAQGRDLLLGGAGDDTLGGGKDADTLDGGDGNDRLQAALGHDLLTGGAGADLFVFSTRLDAATNVDTLTDFEPGVDQLLLAAGIFSGLQASVGQNIGLGSLLGYDPANGVLSYDADGSGAGAPVAFAILGVLVHPAGLGTDFLVVA